MKVLFHLGHPAHFHLFKNIIQKLNKTGNESHVLIKNKDVLIELLENSGFDYRNILPEGKSNSRLGMITDLLKRGKRLINYCKIYKPDLLIGTSADISYVGKYLNIPAVNVQEDDASVVPLHAWIAYPWATAILSPTTCDNGRWNKKTIRYEGYHELAYLHPDNFIPDKTIVAKYTDPHIPFFILRFASLHAHHDTGIRGIDDKIALQLIHKILPHGEVIISSERQLADELEPYRSKIEPIDMHHILSFSKLLIGDSQTMSAEAAVLGTPYIRFNDFVGRIGYLSELENNYQLGFGISPDQPDLMINKAVELATIKNIDNIFNERRQRMLSEKINVADFLYNYIIDNFKSN